MSKQAKQVCKRALAGGFSLIELMIVVVIVAVLLMVAVPAFDQITLSTRLKAYANDFVASVHFARGEAIKRNVPVTLCASDLETADNNNEEPECVASGDWEQGWIVVDPNERVLRRRDGKLNKGFKFTSTGGTQLTFDSTGVSSTQSTMKVCQKTPKVGSQDREIQVSITGRPGIKRTTTGTCP